MKVQGKPLSRDFYWALGIGMVLIGAMIGATVYLTAREDDGDDAYIPKNTPLTAEIELLQEYIRIDTRTGNEMPGAIFLVDQLKEAGVEAEIIESAPGRANVYARIPGRSDEGGLLLLHHIDVHPAHLEGWDHPPFGAEIHLNMMWGRGTLDMKGIGICHLLAFLDVARSGEVPEHDLVFLAVADEERGGGLGADWLTRNRPDIFEGIAYAMNEGGITEMIREKIVYFAIETGGKQFATVRLNLPNRESADELREQLNRGMYDPEPERILPEVREYFQAIAPHRIVYQELLSDIDQTVANGRFSELPRPYRLLTQNNAAARPPLELADGTWALDVVIQYLPDQTPEEPIRALRDRVAENIQGFEILTAPEDTAPISPTDSAFFTHLAESVRAQYGDDVDVGPYLLFIGSTDCRFLRQQSIQCYGLWPFPVDYYQSITVHRKNERLRLNWFLEGVELTRRVVWGYSMPSDEN